MGRRVGGYLLKVAWQRTDQLRHFVGKGGTTHLFGEEVLEDTRAANALLEAAQSKLAKEAKDPDQELPFCYGLDFAETLKQTSGKFPGADDQRRIGLRPATVEKPAMMALTQGAGSAPYAIRAKEGRTPTQKNHDGRRAPGHGKAPRQNGRDQGPPTN